MSQDLLNKIRGLQEQAQSLEPDPIERQQVRDQVIDYTEHFLDNLAESRAWNDSVNKGRGVYEAPITEGPAPIEELLTLLEDEVNEPHLNAASGGHLAYIPSGGIYFASLADYVASIINKYASMFYTAPGAVRMENMLINWFSELVGYPEGAAGNLTSGGSIANLTAIIAARDAHQLKPADYKNTVIYASPQMHHCLNRAIHVAGLSEVILRDLPLDDGHRIIASEVERIVKNDSDNGLKPWLMIASAGTTDVGAVDPLEALGRIAKEHRMWYHVDGAYGGLFTLVDELRDRFKGIELSDSVVMDPHKGLFIPYGTGVVIVKKAENLVRPFDHSGNYMQDAYDLQEELSPSDISLELTKPFRALRLWLPLKIAGLAPFRASLEEKLLLTRYFHEEIQKIEGFEAGPEPDLSIATFRYIDCEDPDQFNRQLVDLIRKDGRVFLSSTLLDGQYVIRFACLSFRTHLSQVDLLLQLIKEKIAILK